MSDLHKIEVEVNGARHEATVESRLTLADFIRDRLGLTGTHLGCEHGVCGACTVLVDGTAVRSCLMLAVQAERASIETVEGLDEDGRLNRLQQAFADQQALQCGFCTPGFLISATELLRETPDPTEEQVRDAVAGHLCRCTGYVSIIAAIRAAADAPSRSRPTDDNETVPR